MANVVVGLIVFLLVAWALRHIYKQKKSGAKCMGCSNAKSCSGGCCGK